MFSIFQLSSTRRLLATAVMLAGFVSIAGTNHEGDSDVAEQPPNPVPASIRLAADHAWLAPGESAEIEATVSDGTWLMPAAFADDHDSGGETVPSGVAWFFDEDSTTSGSIRIIATGAAEAGQFAITLVADLDTRDDQVDAEARVLIGILPAGAPSPGATQNAVAVSAGGAHALALLADGSVWAWGDNSWGQLGDGTLISRHRPAAVQGLTRPVVAIAAGERHSLALLDNGTVAAWGARDRSQFLDTEHDAPENVTLEPTLLSLSDPTPSLVDVVAIAAGDFHNLVIRGDGSVRAWGDNGNAQAGEPLHGLASRPEAVLPDSRVPLPGSAALPPAASLAPGGAHSLVLMADGTAEGFGYAAFGQLGAHSSSGAQHPPINVGLTPSFRKLAAGESHSLFIRNDDVLLTLGANNFGQLGDGSRNNNNLFQQPPFLGPVMDADGGRMHSLALQTNGEVWAWGNNTFGQAGANGSRDGVSDIQLVPVRVPGLDAIDSVAAGGRFSLALEQRCGQVWAWGDNVLGQLGNGGASAPGAAYLQPVPVFGFGEGNAESGCTLVLTVLSRGEGQGTITVDAPSSTPVIDADCETQACTAAVPRNAIVTLSAQPAAGSQFAGWTGDCSGISQPLDVTMDRSRNCYATFDTISGLGPRPVAAFSATPNPALAGETISFDASASSDDGAIVSYDWDLTAGGAFDDANGVRIEFAYSTAGTRTISLQVTDDQGLTDVTSRTVDVQDAGTTAELTIVSTGDGSGTVTSAPAGIDCGSDCIESFPLNTAVTLTATPAIGSRFDGWSGDADCADGQVTMTVDTSCTATFTALAQQSYTLTITSVTGNGTVTTGDGLIDCPGDCSQVYPEGTSVFVSANNGPGGTFVTWGGDCDFGAQTGINLLMNSDFNCTAEFTP